MCAAVSALTVNAINSIDELTDDAADVQTGRRLSGT
ncbi:MAG: ribosomal-processing cysteine protease Prp [Lachnospiraceae bacterium]